MANGCLGPNVRNYSELPLDYSNRPEEEEVPTGCNSSRGNGFRRNEVGTRAGHGIWRSCSDHGSVGVGSRDVWKRSIEAYDCLVLEGRDIQLRGV